MPRTHSWEVSDQFWALVEPLIPASHRSNGKEYKRRPGAGRKAKYSDKTYFSAIVYILRTGLPWNSLPREKFDGLGPSTLHAKFQKWERSGFFQVLWQHGLAEYDEMAGIAWEWQSTNGAGIETPLAQKLAGYNSMDRGKKWRQQKSPHRGIWRPALDYRLRSQSA